MSMFPGAEEYCKEAAVGCSEALHFSRIRNLLRAQLDERAKQNQNTTKTNSKHSFSICLNKQGTYMQSKASQVAYKKLDKYRRVHCCG